MARAAVALLVLALAAACGGGGDGKTVELTASDSGSTVEVAVGDRIVISLDSNPSTGYRWVEKSGAGDVLTLVSSEYEAPETELVGASGIERWTYEAAADGTASIELEYEGPGDGEIGGQFAATVEVTG